MAKPTEPLFHKGDTVILRTTREMCLVVEDPVQEAGEYWYELRFSSGIRSVPEEDLEAVEELEATIESLARNGKWGRLTAFRRALAVERILNKNQSTVYAFNSQRIQYQPYQYKPLLKVLDSPDRKLLIADEVGLGKTIEAGLILTEFEARSPLDKILVVCPSRLREKWRDEMNRKFSQDFDILTRDSLEQYCQRVQENPRRTRLRGIISMQTLRSAELVEILRASVQSLDLVVVDEAHHARNPATLTAHMLQELGDLGSAVLLLTATPLHLGNRDLFTLLNALRPTEFRDEAVFDSRLQEHRGVLQALALVRMREAERLGEAHELLTRIFVTGVPENSRDPLAQQVLEDLIGPPPAEVREWVDLERRVQDLHPLSTIVTRTRKRDVQEKAPTRRAGVHKCQWTEEEVEIYQQLVLTSSTHGWFDVPLTLGQIQRARQAASCLPAAIAARNERIAKEADEAVELTDIFLEDDDEPVGRGGPESPQVASLKLIGVDSKYEKLREILDQVWEEEPGAKILIFTFFVGTSRYLQRRLSEDGHPSLRIAGDVVSNPHRPDLDERGRRLRQFRTDPGVHVMVSTEVGSEGLDFQFCHRVVNYDLPWNPMVVEQRIGRIDRFGQESEVVHIENIVVEGSVEDRILHRLYDRIGIFRRSIGDLDSILGETITQLQSDYIRGRLTPSESDRRLQEAVAAVERRAAYQQELEKRAVELFGHEDYITTEMKRVQKLGRFLSTTALLSVVEGYLEACHGGLKLSVEEPEVYAVRLTAPLRRAIHSASDLENFWMERSPDGFLHFTTNGDLAFRNGARDLELLNANHPLIKAAVRGLQAPLKDPGARVGQASLVLPKEHENAFSPGLYALVVYVLEVVGMRSRRLIEPIAVRLADGDLVLPDPGEHLLHLVLNNGVAWDLEDPAPPIAGEAWDIIQTEARNRFRALRTRERDENAARYLRRRAAVEAEHERSRGNIERKLETARSRERSPQILALFQRQLDSEQIRFDEAMGEIEEGREPSVRLEAPIAACVVEVTRNR